MSGMQSQCFAPTDWVDISDVAEQKRRACDCHVSQGMDHIYEWHGDMERFRGREFHCDRAEAFVHLRRSNNDIF
jgi:LmbE family N-acetylglucosaminyl deacetylase